MVDNFDDLIEERGRSLIEFYRDHPILAANDLLGADLDVVQRLVFKDMWFKKYCMFVGGRGTGKSVACDSMVIFKDEGLCYLNEILSEIPTYLKDGETEEREFYKTLFTSDGFKNTKQVSLEKNIKGKKVITQSGFELKCGETHPLLTINDRGEFVYKKITEFLVGDFVCIQRGQNYWNNNNIPIDDSYLIGQFIGDGYIKKANGTNITTSDECTKKFCIDYCIKNNILYRVDDDLRTRNTSKIYFKKLDWFFKKYKIHRCLSYYKSIPYSIRSANKEAQVAFLQGYFDSDGSFELRRGRMSCCSVSKKLMKEIQMMLLNFGVVSRVRKKKTKSKFGVAYILEFCSYDVLTFKEKIGFRLDRKQRLLEQYCGNIKEKFNTNKDIIPFIKNICFNITEDYRLCNKGKLPSFSFKISNIKDCTYVRLNKFINRMEQLIKLSYIFSFKSLHNLEILKNISKNNYYFDKITIIEDWVGDCYDFEMDMEEEPNYFTNGFISHNTFLLGTISALRALLYPGERIGLLSNSFRQSKKIFAIVEYYYESSPIFRQACAKRPIHGSDSHYLEFKKVRGIGSIIDAIPIGDGSKIRGSRYYLIVMDELAQIDPRILDRVIRPMAATSKNPMVKVRELERRKRLIESGLATEDSFEEFEVNKLIMASSGYFKFNHMWKRMCDYWNQIEMDISLEREPRHAVWQVPYNQMSPGFLDDDGLKEANRTMSSFEFRMEYGAEMIKDSEGFFKASLLEECSHMGFTVETRGDPSAEYILGVDPNQGGEADCGIVVIKRGADFNRIVNIEAIRGDVTQNIAKAIQRLCRTYNIVRIMMDRGGGGKSVADLLTEGYGGNVMLMIGDDTHKDSEGRRIVNLVTFSSTWIGDANFTTLSMLEAKRLCFPDPSVSSSDAANDSYDAAMTLKSQMLNIVVTQTSGGVLHFDTPKKGQKKDLYSALILAAQGVRDIEIESSLYVDDNILYGNSGMIRPHAPSAVWDVVDDSGFGNNKDFGIAVLPPKIK